MTTKTSDWQPGPTVCRCCLTEGCYKDISTEYFWMGKREVYAELLNDTLNISIAYAKAGPNSNSRLICEPCISRLRDAHDFRRQVLECEKTFMQYLDPGSSGLQSATLTLEEVKVEQVKQEKKLSDDEDFDDRVDFVVNDDTDDDLDDEPLMKLATKVPKKEKEVDLLDLLDSTQITVKRKSTASSSKAKEPAAKKAKKREIVIKPSASKTASKAVAKVGEKKKKEITSNVITRKNSTLLVQYTTAYPFRLPAENMCCFVCGKEFPDPDVFRLHMAQEDHKLSHKMLAVKQLYPKNVLKVEITDLRCRICSSAFHTITDIAAHLSNDHALSGINTKYHLGVHPYKINNGAKSCLFCLQKFVSLRALSRHSQTHYHNYTCETCGKAYSSRCTLQSHTRFAHLDRNTWCQNCRAIFQSAEEKAKHMKESRRCWPYSCTVCGERFAKLILKETHSKLMHKHTDQYVCPECPKLFTNYTTRQAHFVAKHTNKYNCSSCDKTFQSKAKLEKHSIMHSSKETFQCDICFKTFNGKDNLTQHMLIHGKNKPFKCKVCNKHFKHKCNLVSHLTTHGNEKPFKGRKTTASNRELGNHSAQHSSGKSFKCKICFKKFQNKEKLKQHVPIHNDENRSHIRIVPITSILVNGS